MTNKEYQQEIRETAFSNGMPERLSELIAAQAAHETGWFSSNAFKQNCNLFGYKYVKGAKWQLGAGRISTEGDPYAKYNTIYDSVNELTDWIKRRQKQGKFPKDLDEIQTPDQYAKLLKSCGYYGADVSEYISGLTHGLKGLV